MARKKAVTSQNDNDNKPVDGVEEFEEEVGVDIEDNDHEEAASEDEDINALLSDPAKAVDIASDDQEDKEEVMYCPNCGVTGLFVDSVCMNCGEKKGKKTINNINDSTDDIMDDFQEEESVSLEEY